MNSLLEVFLSSACHTHFQSWCHIVVARALQGDTKRWGEAEMGGEERFILRHWLPCLWWSTGPKSEGLGRQARDLGKSWCCSLCLKVICRQKSLFLWRGQSFLKGIRLADEWEPSLWRVTCLNSESIHLNITCTCVCDQICGYLRSCQVDMESEPSCRCFRFSRKNMSFPDTTFCVGSWLLINYPKLWWWKTTAI